MHVYHVDPGVDTKTVSDIFLDGSKVGELGATDRLDLSAGIENNNDETVATDQNWADNIRTYTMVKDSAGKVTVSSSKAKTDISKEMEAVNLYNYRVLRDIYVTTYETEKGEYGIQLRKKMRRDSGNWYTIQK